jgi:hypothetical protein
MDNADPVEVKNWKSNRIWLWISISKRIERMRPASKIWFYLFIFSAHENKSVTSLYRESIFRNKLLLMSQLLHETTIRFTDSYLTVTFCNFERNILNSSKETFYWKLWLGTMSQRSEGLVLVRPNWPIVKSFPTQKESRLVWTLSSTE